MAIANDFALTNFTNSKAFYFRGCQLSRMRKEQPSQSLPFVNLKPESNILFRFTGQLREIGFTFRIFDDGTDMSGGTHTSSVDSTAEQIDYLYSNGVSTGIYTEQFDDYWSLDDLNDQYFTGTINGNIEHCEIVQEEGQLNRFVGELMFKQGTVQYTVS